MQVDLIILTATEVVVAATAVAAIAATFVARFPAAALAFAAMLLAESTGAQALTPMQTAIWAIAAMIATLISLMLPAEIARSRKGLGHICGGTLAGAAIGAVSGTQAGIIMAAAAGMILGGMAYARTKAATVMAADRKKYSNYVLAKGMPAIVSISMSLVAMLSIIS